MAAIINLPGGGVVRLDAFVTGDLKPIGSLGIKPYGINQYVTVDLERDQMIVLRDSLTALINRRS